MHSWETAAAPSPPEKGRAGWAAGPRGRCGFGIAVSSRAVAACPASQLAKRRSAGTEAGQLPASPETRLGCLRAFIYFA